MLVNDLENALNAGNDKAVDEIFESIIAAIHDDDPSVDALAIAKINCLLRNNRKHEHAKRFSEALVIEEKNTFDTDKHYAQALIDTGMAAASLPGLHLLAAKENDNFKNFAEAKGLIGWVHKDLFINAKDKKKLAAINHLNKSLEAYAEPWKRDSDKTIWHASNLLALISRAEAEGISVPNELNRDAIADSLESAVKRVPEKHRNYWDWASLAEGYVGREKWSEATNVLMEALGQKDNTPFQLNGTLRQFKEVWRLPERSAEGANMVTAIERSMLGRPNGEVSLRSADIERQMKTSEGDLEALHSHHKMRSHKWVKKYLGRGDNVGSVIDKHSGVQKGTCCVIEGGYISESYKGQLLCLTNDHVISEYPEFYSDAKKPLNPADAAVRFTASEDEDKKYQIYEIVWSSPYMEHDTCIFRLEDYPPLLGSNLPIVDYVPTINEDKPQQVFVISHPEKDSLSYSFQNTDLVDHDAKVRGKDTLIPGLIHYKTPTIPGSSGGVALNAELDMIGLHHAGGTTINKLNGDSGKYAVNEAIWIQPILNAARADIKNQKSRWDGS